jgi:hypothetical protein
VVYLKARKKWLARIAYGGRQHYIGHFKTPEEASAAYYKSAKNHYGEFARAK